MTEITSRTWWYLFPVSYAQGHGRRVFYDPDVALRDWFEGSYCSAGYGPLGDFTGASPEEIEIAVADYFSDWRGASSRTRSVKTYELTAFQVEMSVGDVLFTSPKSAQSRVYVGLIRGEATWHPDGGQGHERRRLVQWLNDDKPLHLNFRGRNDSRLLFELNDRQRGLAQAALQEADLLSKLNDAHAGAPEDEAVLQPFQDEVDRDPDSGARETVLRAIAVRRGQTEFRRKLLDLYAGRCAISGCDVEAALEAAHVVPHSEGGRNNPDNGLLLRADLHTLFDLHMLTITENHEVSLHPALRTGSHYANLHGHRLSHPASGELPPDRTLAKHRKRCAWTAG